MKLKLCLILAGKDIERKRCFRMFWLQQVSIEKGPDGRALSTASIQHLSGLREALLAAQNAPNY